MSITEQSGCDQVCVCVCSQATLLPRLIPGTRKHSLTLPYVCVCMQVQPDHYDLARTGMEPPAANVGLVEYERSISPAGLGWQVGAAACIH